MRSFVALLLGLSSTITAATGADDGAPPEPPCRTRAWVRALDLKPGQILQGDVRIKLDGMCTDVSSYSLGLRFAERSWVKTRREGVTLPERPTGNQSSSTFSNDSIFETGVDFPFWGAQGVEPSVWEKYQNDIKDPALWLAREEERVGFETTHSLLKGEQLSHELEQSFGILVPFTNYPPALDMTFSLLGYRDQTDVSPKHPLAATANQLDHSGLLRKSADSEHIYSYFVEVTFANGTLQEVPAGYTSFHAAIKPQSSEMETIKVPATRKACEKGHDCSTESIPSDEFTLEVTFPNGRHFTQGSVNNVTVISHQLGPGLQRPFAVQSLKTKVKQKREWAANLAADNETAELILATGPSQTIQLLPVIDDELFLRRVVSAHLDNESENPRFSQMQNLENGTAFSTEAITMPLRVPPDCYPPFAMYYQSTEVSLEVILEVRNISSAGTIAPEEDEKYDWTPKKEETEHLHASIPLFVHPPLENEFVDREPIHYLSPGARAPIFVEPASIPELLLKSMDDRDQLAPISQAKVITSTDGNIVKHRYYSKASWRGANVAPYYVGDTWLRKVLA